MRRLHVLHMIGGGDTGGAMSHLLPLLSALERAGCDVHLACLGEGGLAEEAGRRGLSVVVLPMMDARDPRVLGPLRRLLEAGPEGMPAAGVVARPTLHVGAARWDVVHTHGMRANLPARLVMKTVRRRPCVLTTVHSDLRLDYSVAGVARAYQEIDRLTLGGVDRVICVSDALRGLLAARGYPAERLVTVRSGLEGLTGYAKGLAAARDPADVGRPGREPTPADSDTAPVDGATPRRLRIGTVARLVAVKDIDLMVEVAALLRRTHPEVELTIVGDGPERERLEALVADRGLSGRVRFVGRLSDTGSLLAKLDVYVVTSVFEGGVSMSVLEAMALGLPVVTTAAGGVAEAVVDGETGYVVERRDGRGALAAALAERAAALLDDPALRARMGAAGARRVRSGFTVEETAKRTLRVYERCLVGRGELL
ncbi:MAG: glycosyltransferase family 4 protein [Actinobacteria bacterium]|nr:glycosyltransferase family 4 protein [Actinomycetota bacterium]